MSAIWCSTSYGHMCTHHIAHQLHMSHQTRFMEGGDHASSPMLRKAKLVAEVSFDMAPTHHNNKLWRHYFPSDLLFSETTVMWNTIIGYFVSRSPNLCQFYSCFLKFVLFFDSTLHFYLPVCQRTAVHSGLYGNNSVETNRATGSHTSNWSPVSLLTSWISYAGGDW